MIAVALLSVDVNVRVLPPAFNAIDPPDIAKAPAMVTLPANFIASAAEDVLVNVILPGAVTPMAPAVPPLAAAPADK